MVVRDKGEGCLGIELQTIMTKCEARGGPHNRSLGDLANFTNYEI